jgi:hypothetical protein
MIDLSKPAVFEPHLNTQFVVHAPGGDVPVTLTAVEKKIDDEIQLCFVVHFTGPTPALPQGIYRMTHDVMGEFEIFIVPVHSRRPGILYEAGFNLLREDPRH